MRNDGFWRPTLDMTRVRPLASRCRARKWRLLFGYVLTADHGNLSLADTKADSRVSTVGSVSTGVSARAPRSDATKLTSEWR